MFIFLQQDFSWNFLNSLQKTRSFIVGPPTNDSVRFWQIFLVQFGECRKTLTDMNLKLYNFATFGLVFILSFGGRLVKRGYIISAHTDRCPHSLLIAALPVEIFKASSKPQIILIQTEKQILICNSSVQNDYNILLTSCWSCKNVKVWRECSTA